MPDWSLHEFTDRETLDTTLAESTAQALRSSLRQRDFASLVVSGGSTPKGVFAKLAAQSLDWERVRITLADERWVSPDHADSNERLVHEHLMQGPAAAAEFISLITADADARDAEVEIAHRLAGFDVFDVVLLGMGEDGHTASLFPGSDALSAGLDLDNPSPCLAVSPLHAPHQRMSLTLRRLLKTRRLILHITGASKRQVLDEAMGQGDALRLPVAALTRGEKNVDVYWAP